VSELLRLQFLFARLLPRLLDYVRVLGLQASVGECYRPPETAKLYASQGRGSSNSLHTLKLAVDLQLFVLGNDGNYEYMKGRVGYEPLGEYWEKLSISCAWGGRFAHADFNHFSVGFEGRR
jgi:hypothetical protein